MEVTSNQFLLMKGFSYKAQQTFTEQECDGK